MNRYSPTKNLLLSLRKDLTRDIKRGHVWIYGDAVDRPSAPSGSVATLVDRRGEKIACGMYDPDHPIRLRICRTVPPWELDEQWFQERALLALSLRRAGLDRSTTGFRLFNGEGDGLPGLIVDVYQTVGVIKLDGGAPQQFYNVDRIAQWLMQNVGLTSVVHRPRERGQVGKVIAGDLPVPEVPFLENGMKFLADVIHGQKTGFFLDQRDNRDAVRRLAANRTVLNLFSFSGGFSIAAGRGGATHVTSVDLAPAAIETANRHWHDNGLTLDQHRGSVCDAFEFLEQAIADKRTWDFVICDPPSFAPSEKARVQASEAYQRLAQYSARVTAAGGLLALASCSSHIRSEDFWEINLAGLGRARRVGTQLLNRGLPIDHPTPLAMPELSYLKFQLLCLR